MTAATVAHAITGVVVAPAVEVLLPHFDHRAECVCGWYSCSVPPSDAAEAGWAHLDRHRPRALPVAGPVQCADWCIESDGHADAFSAEDQCCVSEQLRVEMSVEPAVRAGRDDEDEMEPDHVDVSAMRRPLAEVHDTVAVSRNGGPDMLFTPTEARQLIEALQLVLGQLEGGTR